MGLFEPGTPVEGLYPLFARRSRGTHPSVTRVPQPTRSKLSQLDQNGTDNLTQIRIRCTECHFQQTVTPKDDTIAADIVIQHGQETGHKLNVSHIDPQ